MPATPPVDVTGLGPDLAAYAQKNNLQGPHTSQIQEDGWSWAAWDTVILTQVQGQGIKVFISDAGWAVRHIQMSRDAVAKQLSDAQAVIPVLKQQLKVSQAQIADAQAEIAALKAQLAKPAPVPVPAPVPAPISASKPNKFAELFAALARVIKSLF